MRILMRVPTSKGWAVELGTSVVVSNVTGSGGSIASRQVKDSESGWIYGAFTPYQQ